METTLRKHSPDQYAVMHGKRMVAYVCLGKRMPINWLPGKCAGVVLTLEEKETVARYVRTEMDRLTAEHEQRAGNIQMLTKGEEIEPDERADPIKRDTAEDSGGSGS